MDNFMEQGFIDILKQIVTEQVNAVLSDTKQFKSVLADYTRNEFKKESRFLIQAVEAGVAKAIKETDDLPACKRGKINELVEDYGLSQEVSAAIVDTLALVLRGDTSKSVTATPAVAPSCPVATEANAAVYAKTAAPAPSIEMVLVPGGSFKMGDVKDESWDESEKPVHTVTLTKFYIGKYAVTQAQYQAVMGSNPSKYNSNPTSGEAQENRPVEMISWYDAIVFCNKLSMMEGLSPAYRINNSTNPADWGSVPISSNSTWNAVQIVSGSNGYRLPTEAQWEYAAKGGNGSPGNYTFAGSNNARDVAWYEVKLTHEVGKKAPNGLGLYDMSGNVNEWCWDWYGDYSASAQTDPAGPSVGTRRVRRGSNFFHVAAYTTSCIRASGEPHNRYEYDGFRLVRP